MNVDERLVPYVIQGIEDDGGSPCRTRVLKIIYLIDVDYYRRHRRTLTAWHWLYYYFGPYAFEYPRVLEDLSISLIDEQEGETDNGNRFYMYHVADDQELYDILSPGDQVVIDETISRWSLEDLNLLLSHVYFHTEPMIGSKPGEILDFGKITADAPTWQPDPETITIAQDTKAHFTQGLADARRKSEARRLRTSEHLHKRPIRRDASYRAAIEARDKEEGRTITDGIDILVKQQ